MSYDQTQGLAWVVVTLVAEIPPLVRSWHLGRMRCG